MQPTRVVAVDWSGAKHRAEQRIWLADVRAGRLVRLENGRDRASMTAELVGMARETARTGERVLIGLDFGFGFPAWYGRSRGWTRGHDAWRAFTSGAVDAVLHTPAFPFWGRGPSRTRPLELTNQSDTPPLRETERALSPGARPFSVFQLVGAGAVGTASLRGMATLHALSEAGATIWPFDQDSGGSGAVVVEVWPRLAAPHVVKSNVDARLTHLESLAGTMDGLAKALDAVRASDDAFDALVAAVALWRERTALARLPSDSSPTERLEGRILTFGRAEAPAQ